MGFLIRTDTAGRDKRYRDVWHIFCVLTVMYRKPEVCLAFVTGQGGAVNDILIMSSFCWVNPHMGNTIFQTYSIEKRLRMDTTTLELLLLEIRIVIVSSWKKGRRKISHLMLCEITCFTCVSPFPDLCAWWWWRLDE